jgi:hypothetical protein
VLNGQCANASRAPQSDAALTQGVVEKLVSFATHQRHGRFVVRDLSDHPFVILRIPGRGSDEGIELALGKVVHKADAIWFDSHLDDRTDRFGGQG